MFGSRESPQTPDLTRRHKLRGYDAVQLASALIANAALSDEDFPPLVFVAADNDLLAAAKAEGLPAENPNDYTAHAPG